MKDSEVIYAHSFRQVFGFESKCQVSIFASCHSGPGYLNKESYLRGASGVSCLPDTSLKEQQGYFHPQIKSCSASLCLKTRMGLDLWEEEDTCPSIHSQACSQPCKGQNWPAAPWPSVTIASGSSFKPALFSCQPLRPSLYTLPSHCPHWPRVCPLALPMN